MEGQLARPHQIVEELKAIGTLLLYRLTAEIPMIDASKPTSLIKKSELWEPMECPIKHKQMRLAFSLKSLSRLLINPTIVLQCFRMNTFHMM